MEQGERKVKQIRGRMSGIEEDRVAALEKQGRALKAKDRTGRRVTCRTCTQPTHEQGKCPGKQVIWFLREQTGHFKGLPTCSTHFKKKTNKNLQGTAERTRAVADDTDSETNNDQVGRVIEQQKEDVRALVDPSSKLAQVVMIALDHGISSHAAKSNLLIDSGVNKTLLSEKDWQQIRPHHIPRKPKLKKNKTNFTPFGTKIRLLILRRTKVSL